MTSSPLLLSGPAQRRLDALIKSDSVHEEDLIEIAEVLWHARQDSSIDVADERLYVSPIEASARRAASLFGLDRHLFSQERSLLRFLSPTVLRDLDASNKRSAGAVEAYLYQAIQHRYSELEAFVRFVRSLDSDSYDPWRIERYIHWHLPFARSRALEVLTQAVAEVDENFEFKFRDARVTYLRFNAVWLQQREIGEDIRPLMIICERREVAGFKAIIQLVGKTSLIIDVISVEDVLAWHDRLLSAHPTLLTASLSRLLVKLEYEFPQANGLDDFILERRYALR